MSKICYSLDMASRDLFSLCLYSSWFAILCHVSGYSKQPSQLIMTTLGLGWKAVIGPQKKHIWLPSTSLWLPSQQWGMVTTQLHRLSKCTSVSSSRSLVSSLFLSHQVLLHLSSRTMMFKTPSSKRRFWFSTAFTRITTFHLIFTLAWSSRWSTTTRKTWMIWMPSWMIFPKAWRLRYHYSFMRRRIERSSSSKTDRIVSSLGYAQTLNLPWTLTTNTSTSREMMFHRSSSWWVDRLTLCYLSMMMRDTLLLPLEFILV